MARALSFLIRYFSNYYTLHRSDLAARAASLDPRLEIFEKHAPPIEKRVKGRPCPWMNNELKTTLNRRDVLLRRARKTNEDADWHTRVFETYATI